jgi:hypothetical protein
MVGAKEGSFMVDFAHEKDCIRLLMVNIIVEQEK